jgi:PAS domain S-box-containing protein
MFFKAAGVARFFKPPVFEDDEEKTRQAFILNYLLIYLFSLIMLSGLVGVPFFFVKKLGASIFVLTLAGTFFFSKTLLQKGQVRSASQFLLSALWIIFMAIIVLGNGLKDLNFVFWVALTVAAGLLLGLRFAAFTAIISGLSYLALVFIERSGVLPVRYFPIPPMARWIQLTFSLILAAVVLGLALRSRNEALNTARNQLTELRLTEEALRESERRYRLIAENVADIIWTMDLNFNFTYISPSVTRMRGYTVEEALAQTLPEIVTPASLQVALKAIEEDQEQRRQNPNIDRKLTVELEEYRKDGSTFWTENEITYLRGENQELIGIVGVTRDISGKKRIEAALRESEERFRSLIQSSSDIVMIIDERGQVTYESPSMERILGYRPGYFIGKSPLSAVHPQDLDRVRQDLDDVFRSINTGIPTDFRCRKADGSWIYLEAVGSNQFGNPGVGGIVINVRDITQRKAVEKALRESEAQYRALIETTNTGFVIIDPEGRVLDANEEYVRLTGYRDLEGISGRGVIEWTADHEKVKNAEAVRECLREGKIRNLEIDYVDSEGKVTPIEINATVVEKEGSLRVLTLCRDITERKQVEQERQGLEERLRRAEKMESLGRLAGGWPMISTMSWVCWWVIRSSC